MASRVCRWDGSAYDPVRRVAGRVRWYARPAGRPPPADVPHAAGGCDIGGIVSSQLGHKYADELYGIHTGSGLPLDLFTGPRAWDFARNRPLTDDQPAGVRARIIELDHRSASHLAVHVLDGATLAHGLSDSPA